MIVNVKNGAMNVARIVWRRGKIDAAVDAGVSR
jgi:hypothetical protein